MDNLNEKIQKAYLNSIVFNRKDIDEEKLIDQYLEVIELLEDLNIKLDEKWEGKQVKIQHTGEHEGKSIAQLKKEIKAGRGKLSKEKMSELIFALRSKEGWPKGKGSSGL